MKSTAIDDCYASQKLLPCSPSVSIYNEEMNKIEWLTIPAPDLEKAKSFYEEVFKFEVNEFSERFWVFKAGNISGGLDADQEAAEQGIGFSITVEDMEKTITLLIHYGGEIIRDRYILGQNAGYCAKFKDPNGNKLELYSAV